MLFGVSPCFVTVIPYKEFALYFYSKEKVHIQSNWVHIGCYKHPMWDFCNSRWPHISSLKIRQASSVIFWFLSTKTGKFYPVRGHSCMHLFLCTLNPTAQPTHCPLRPFQAIRSRNSLLKN